MAELRGDDIGVADVSVGHHAEEVGPRNPVFARGLGEEAAGRLQDDDAVVGDAVVVLVQVVEREAGGAVQPERQGGGRAPAAGPDQVAVLDVVGVGQQVHAQRRGGVELVVQVGGRAIVLGGARRRLDVGLVAHVGGLGDGVDHAAGGAAAEQGA